MSHHTPWPSLVRKWRDIYGWLISCHSTFTALLATLLQRGDFTLLWIPPHRLYNPAANISYRLKMTTSARPAEAVETSSAATAVLNRSTSSASILSALPTCPTTGTAGNATINCRPTKRFTGGPLARCSISLRSLFHAPLAYQRRCRRTLRTSRPARTASTRRSTGPRRRGT